jgi:hypothetical protein
MKALIAGLCLASTLAVATAVAQPAPFNEAGVTMGHWHIASKDVQANKKIFVGMGGTPFTVGAAESVRFPGVIVNLSLGTAAGTGGSQGSMVNHVGFIVNNVQWRRRAARRQQQVGPGLRRDAGRVAHGNPRRQDPDDADPQ